MSEHIKLIERLQTAAFEEGMIESDAHPSFSNVNKAAVAVQKAKQELLTYIHDLQLQHKADREHING